MSPVYGLGGPPPPTTVDASHVITLDKRLGELEPKFQRAVRSRLRAVGQDFLQQAITNASAFSTRIPHALSLRVTLSRKRSGVTVVASVATAPHARVMEGIVSDVFRHPVFGDTNDWVPQDAHPYIMPAALRSQKRITEVAEEAIAQAFHDAGVT